jgi:nucleoside-diphosphate-sugar epimerase
MKNILVTGGAGAIGSNLARTLLSLDYNVIILDDLSSGFKENVDARAKFYEGSLLENDLLVHIFQKHKIDFIFHLAALFANQNSVEHPALDLQVNGHGTLSILEKAHKYKVQKVVYTSSSCVYGAMPTMSDRLPLEGKLDTPYAITKLLGEQYCQFFSSFHGLNTTIVRLFNVYGPGEKPGQYRNVIPNMFSKAIKGEPLIITGTGDETRDFTFVEDVMNGMIQACLGQSAPGEIFNLGSGVPTSIQTLVDTINLISGNKSPTIYRPRRSWDHVLHRIASIEKARNEIAFMPKTTLMEGLSKTFEWLLTNE